MLTKQKFKIYDDINDLLEIEPEDINKPIYYQDKKIPHHPIWFAIQEERRDIIVALVDKQKQGDVPIDPLVTSSYINFAYSLAIDALKKRDFPLFISHFKALTLIDESSKVNCFNVMEELDRFLNSLSKNDLKLMTKALLKAIKDISDPNYLNALEHSKFINYLTTAFNGSRTKAKQEFNPDQLRVLNKVGFYHAKNKKDKDGDKVARYFVKQILKQKEHLQPTLPKQQILFFQDLYIDNLAYAVNLINDKTGSQLEVNKSGVCAAFTKIWLHKEEREQAGPENLQMPFFRNLMMIASFTKEEIADKVNNDKDFVRLIQQDAKALKDIHHNDEFQGQFTQRTMKKQFGLELIDEYDISHLNPDRPILAYLRIRYNDGGSGHAIGIHIQQKKVGTNESVMVYKVWDSNDKPKTFSSRSKFMTYINGIKDDATVQEISIYKFSPFSETATREKVLAINGFLNSMPQLDYPANTHERAIINCINLLGKHYDNGVIALNDLIPLFAFLSNILNHSEAGIDLTSLNQVIEKRSLIEPDELDLNAISFLPYLIDSALDQDPPQPEIVTALFGLGLSVEQNYLPLAIAKRDIILEQAIRENNRRIVNHILQAELNTPQNFPGALALKEMIAHPDNKECKSVLARALLAGKMLNDDTWKRLQKRPQTALFAEVNPPYKETLKNLILQQVLQEIKKNTGISLGKKNKALLVMLDYSLNPIHKGNNGCYDILTYGLINEKNIQPREQIKRALQENHITVEPSMQSKYPFLSTYLAPAQTLSVHY